MEGSRSCRDFSFQCAVQEQITSNMGNFCNRRSDTVDKALGMNRMGLKRPYDAIGLVC